MPVAAVVESITSTRRHTRAGLSTQGAAMSISFRKKVGAEVIALMRQLYGEPAASDGQTFLFDRMDRVSRIGMTAIARRAKQPASVGIHGTDDIVTMADGTHYAATPNGWQRVGRIEQ